MPLPGFDDQPPPGAASVRKDIAWKEAAYSLVSRMLFVLDVDVD